jgi:uncharacterized protein (DUF3084 family)
MLRFTPGAWALVVVVAAALVHASVSLAQTAPLELNALVQEGDLILEEAAALAPLNEKLAQEGLELAAAGQALRAEIQALEESIKQFNASMESFNVAAQRYQAQCSQKTDDAALLKSCNARVAELREQALKLDGERPAVEARRKALNLRIDQHNAASKDYTRRKQEFDSRNIPNQSDTEDWLGRARSFFTSEMFGGLLTQTASPSACSPDRIAERPASPASKPVTQAQACLKALKAGLR